MSHDRFYRPILSADIIGDKFSSRTLFYRSSVIGFRVMSVARHAHETGRRGCSSFLRSLIF